VERVASERPPFYILPYGKMCGLHN